MNKTELFLTGRWTAPEPDINPVFWSIATWINWIDNCGEWQ